MAELKFGPTYAAELRFGPANACAVLLLSLAGAV